MSDCPYLIFRESKSCTSCTGFKCLAYGREKKLSDTSICKGDYNECQRYVDAEKTRLIAPASASVESTEEKLVDPTSPTVVELPKPVFVKNPCGCGEDIRLSNCPYQSTKLPEGKQSCTGVWCYANNKSVRVPKNCWNYAICTVYLMSKFKGVPFP